MTVVPVGLLLLGFPIFIILLATSLIILLFFMGVPLVQVHIVMFGSVDKFALMAVPFFIFAGELMGIGGISKRIIDWVLSIIGWVRGSLALTTVGTCTIFGAISGSSPATVAAVGRLMYGPLRESGYVVPSAVQGYGGSRLIDFDTELTTVQIYRFHRRVDISVRD